MNDRGSRKGQPGRRAWALLPLLAAALLSDLWLARSRREGPGERTSEAAAPGLEVAPGPARDEREALEPEPVASAVRAALAADAAPRAPARVRGRVYDVQGEPLPGIPLAFEGGGEVLAHSRADGSFELDWNGTSGKLVARDPAWATVRGSEVASPSAGQPEPVLLLAPALHLAGWVVDEHLRGLEGARLEVEVPLEALARFPYALDTTTVGHDVVRSGARGEFELAGLPALPGARLNVAHGSRALALELPQEDTLDWLIELRGPDASSPHLLGSVLLADGAPADGAQVALGPFTARADVEGRFRLDFASVAKDAALLAVKEGFQPALVPGFGAVVAEHGNAPPPVRLVLGPLALELAGRVQRPDGTPCAGLRVDLVDGTDWNPGTIPPQWVEGLASGGRAATTTDADGRFTLAGLAEREYRVQAWSAETLELVRSPPLPAGARDVVLVLPADALRELSGRVVTRSGRPLAGVTVAAALVYVRTARGSDTLTGPSAVTDAEGRFALARVPREACRLELSAPGILPAQRDIGSDEEDPLELVVDERCHFRVEWSPAAAGETPDGLQAFDPAGSRVALYALSTSEWMTTTYVALSEGSSSVLALGPGRYTLRFLRGAREVAREELDLQPGADVLTLRLPRR